MTQTQKQKKLDFFAGGFFWICFAAISLALAINPNQSPNPHSAQSQTPHTLAPKSKQSQPLQSANEQGTQEAQDTMSAKSPTSIKQLYENYWLKYGAKGECKSEKTSAKNNADDESFVCVYPSPINISDNILINDVQTRIQLSNQNRLKNSTSVKIIYVDKFLSEIQKFLPKDVSVDSRTKLNDTQLEYNTELIYNTKDGFKWRFSGNYIISNPHFKGKNIAQATLLVDMLDNYEINKETDQCENALKEIKQNTKKIVLEDLPKNLQTQCGEFLEYVQLLQETKIHIKEIKILVDSKNVRNMMYEVIADDYKKRGKKLTQENFAKEVKQSKGGISSLSVMVGEDEKVLVDFFAKLVDSIGNAILQKQNKAIGFSIKHNQGKYINLQEWIAAIYGSYDIEKIGTLLLRELKNTEWKIIE